MSLLQPGRCRHCACGGDSCRLPDGERCGWADRTRLVCTAVSCQHAEAARVARAEAERKADERRVREQREAFRKAYIAMSRQGLSHELITEILARRRSGRGKGCAA